MKRIVSAIIVLVLILSCTVTGTSAAQEPQPPFFTLYHHQMMVAGLPKTIKAQFDYDRNYLEIASDYPGYENRGFVFPLATEKYGSLYDVGYTVDDTVVTFTFTLKDGYTLDDYLDAVDAAREAIGARPVSRENGARYSFDIFDVVMTYEDASFWEYMAKVIDFKVLEVVDTEGKELHENGRQDGDVVVWRPQQWLPDPNAPVTPTEPAPDYKYREKLFSQYHLNEYMLKEYDEFYEHTDENGEVDWALVKAIKDVADHPLWTNPSYCEFGNRVMNIEDSYQPFTYGIGVYSAKDDCFYDISSHALYELNDLERVWTDIGVGRLLGDMDDDNILSIADATLIQRCQAGMIYYPTEDQNTHYGEMSENVIKYFSDFDQDGERNITDATAIQRYLIYLPYRSPGWTPYPHKDQPTEPTEAETAAPTETETQAPTEATEPSPWPLATPQITGFNSTAEGVEIHIGAVDGAERYRVYYRNRNDNWVNMGETDSGIFVDKDVAAGSSYRYTVRCVSADTGEFTSDCNTDGWSYTYYPTPKITGCEAVANGVKINWEPVKGAQLYRVYYKGSMGWTKMADVSGTSYVDTDVSPKHRYTYTVRCVSSDGTQFMSDYDANGIRFYLLENPAIDYFKSRMDGIDIRVDAIKSLARIYRKTADGWKRIAELDTQDNSVFRDTDVEPGKTYTYTVRKVGEDGSFLSWYNTSGWSYTYNKSDCIPELEFFMYDGNDMVLIQPKADNKFGIKNFDVNIRFNNEISGNVKVTDEPTYIRSEYFEPDHTYHLEITGTDASGNAITKTGEYTLRTMIAPTNLRAERTGDRQYRFSWDIYYCYPDWYSFGLISTDGEYDIDPGDLTERHVDIDLSAYPQDTEWVAFVSGVRSDGVSVSWIDQINFRESDFS